MPEHVTNSNEIPDAPYYVTMQDPFFSGWGQADEMGADTIAVYIAPCESEAEANTVYANAMAREDQEHVRIVTEKPLPGEGQHVMLMSKEEAPKWYEPGGFTPRTAEELRYNGWTNWETWNVDCWISNDQDASEGLSGLVASDADDDALRAYAMEHVEDDLDADKVNWQEIREHYQEED